MSRPPASDYVELRCRSAFSFLEASSNPEDLVAVAAERHDAHDASAAKKRAAEEADAAKAKKEKDATK